MSVTQFTSNRILRGGVRRDREERKEDREEEVRVMGGGRGEKGRWREGRYPNLHGLVLGDFAEHARHHHDVIDLSLTSHFKTV